MKREMGLLCCRAWRYPALLQGLFLAAIAALIFLAPGDLPLSGDEAMYAAVAKGVADSGEPLDLRLNGLPYLNKPPLFFSAIAVAFRLFGTSDRVAQVAAGFFSLLAVVSLFIGCRLMFGRWNIGLLAALIFLMTPEAIHWGRGVRLEGMLAFFSIIAVAAACLSIDRPQASLVVFLASALACLAKGPQGLFPLALTLLLWWRYRVWRSRALSRWTLLGLAAFLLLVLPWVWWRWGTGNLFVDVYLREQVLATVAGSPWPGRGPTWYVSKLLRTYWPWMPFALAGMAGALAGIWSRESDSRPMTLPEGRRQERALAAWGWYATIVFVIITVSALKKSRYLYLLYPSLAVFGAFALEQLNRRLPPVKLLLMAGVTVAALGMLLVGDRPSLQARANIAEALAVAGGLPDTAPVLLTSPVAEGRHGFGKILGFYARGKLQACSQDCLLELDRMEGNVWIVMRRNEVPRFKRAGKKGKLVLRTARLAVMVFRGSSHGGG